MVTKSIFAKPTEFRKLGLAVGELRNEDGATIFAGKIGASLQKYFL
jgi:hypothetical protein